MLSELENELLAAVNASALKPRLRQVDGLPSLEGEDLVRRFATEAPAVYVAPQPFTVRDGKATVRFGVAGVARNARGQKEARHGDAKAIGLNEILDALAALLDQASTASTSWRVTGVRFMDEAVFYKQGLYVGAVDVEGILALEKGIDESTLDEFAIFHADYDLAPADGTIDATDHMDNLQEL